VLINCTLNTIIILLGSLDPGPTVLRGFQTFTSFTIRLATYENLPADIKLIKSANCSILKLPR